MKQVLLPWMRIGIFTLACLHFSSEIANAQVTADDTVNTQVKQTDDVAEITGGETRGDNLFHSFQDFSVGTGKTAAFLNSNEIANIFSRVTGGNISSIDGLIRANGSANLFLINPAGIIFGEGASLNIGGSFYGSTADSILFEDGEFSATDLDNPPVLTINAPIGLGFRNNPQDIVNQSRTSRTLDSTGQLFSGLQVLEGKNLALIGGDVRLDDGVIFVPDGRLELGGLSAAGTIDINDDGSFSFPDEIARGNVFLDRLSFIDINGGKLKITASKLALTNGSYISAAVSGKGNGGNIKIDANESVTVDGSVNRKDANGIVVETTGISAIDISVSEGATGNGGDIRITTSKFFLTNGAYIFAENLGKGDGGNIKIDATESVTLDQGQISFQVVGLGEGNSGNVRIATPNLVLTDSTIFNSTLGGEGDAGDIKITASSLSLTNSAIYAAASGIGNSGSVLVKADTLALDNGIISTEKVFNTRTVRDDFSTYAEDIPFSSSANAGNVSLEISDKLTLNNESIISAEAASIATGGNVNIDTNFIVAFPNQNNDIRANAEQAAGGNINITAESVLGIEERVLNDLTNDINASSDVFGLDGTVNLNTSDINPLQGSTELPTNVVEVRETSDQTCSVDRRTGTASGLTVTGRGGVHPAPDLPLTSQAILDNDKNTATETNEAQVSAIAPVHTSQGDIIPAQGIVKTEDGRIILTAYRTDGNSRVTQGSANCSK